VKVGHLWSLALLGRTYNDGGWKKSAENMWAKEEVTEKEQKILWWIAS
jgi:hypothetical protein